MHLTSNSKQVQPGSLFVALPPAQPGGPDGHDYIAEAIERGAQKILAERAVDVPHGVTLEVVSSTRIALGTMAHEACESPSQSLQLIGVTGTNGKTTVAWWIEHLLQALIVPVGLMGTVETRWPGRQGFVLSNTTPGSIELNQHLQQMVQAGTQACVMEVSSHALDQQRVHGLHWAAAILTNVTQDHLDYHGDWEAYFQAKMRLFEALPAGAPAVICREDNAWERVAQATSGRVVTYGLSEAADVFAQSVTYTQTGAQGELVVAGQAYPFQTTLIGAHNVQNLLAAVATLTALDFPVAPMVEAMPQFKGVPGRLEAINTGQDFSLWVDYAHTEDALFQVLRILRSIADAHGKKLCVVFGCGGDRDTAKRPLMGKVAAKWADRVVVTSDNPRTEDPEAIAADIVKGLENAATPYEVILDRAQAIETVCAQANADWMILLAGKGHETYQEINGQHHAFDDREVARRCLVC